MFAATMTAARCTEHFMHLRYCHCTVNVCAMQVAMPPALAASNRQQQEFDYDVERQVISADASSSFDAFLAKPEVCTELSEFGVRPSSCRETAVTALSAEMAHALL